jgi:hypothetical protein
MIRSLEDPITLLGIRSHCWARGGVRLVAFAARTRWGGAVGSCDDVSSRDMQGMTLDDAEGGHAKSPGEKVADSESRTLLKTAGKSGRPRTPCAATGQGLRGLHMGRSLALSRSTCRCMGQHWACLMHLPCSISLRTAHPAASSQPDERELLADRRWGLLTRRVPEVIERQCHLGEHGDTPSTRPRSRRTGGGTTAVLAERRPANLGGRDGPQREIAVDRMRAGWWAIPSTSSCLRSREARGLIDRT